MKRPSWDEYFLQIALDVATRATCLRRCYGAVIVSTNNLIVATGYCGSPKGMPNCSDVGICKRQELNIPAGERYELCCSVHAEQNAIIMADPERIRNGTMYLAGFDTNTKKLVKAQPCVMCARVIKNSGIYRIIFWDADKNIHSQTADSLLQSFPLFGG
jgi:dCMP deaminase